MGLVSKEKMLEKLGQFHPDYMFNIASIRNFIKAQPEVDAVPVIRCMDCKHKPEGRQRCFMLKMYTVDDFFCAAGERKEEYEERSDN